MHRIQGVLSAEQLAEIERLLEQAEYVDGRVTAGGAGQSIKENLQIKPMDQYGSEANRLVHEALRKSEAFKSYAMPFKITTITFSRYTDGMHYGDHTDNALQWTTNEVIRLDMSFTIYLSSPDEYEGGELIANYHGEEMAVKYQRGDMAIYPSGRTHRIDPVTSGCRRVAIGWLQSMVPEQDHRDILHAIYHTRNEILVREGRSEHFMRLDFAYSNLLRIWSRV